MNKINNKSNASGALIKNYRFQNNMSEETLANKLQLLGVNLDRHQIFRIEKGKRILKDFELIAICKVLDIDYVELKKVLDNELKSSI